MSYRFNPPHWHAVFVIWTALCAAGVGLGVIVLFIYSVGSSGWQAGMFLIGLCLLAYAGIAAWWLWTQREVMVHQDDLEVRRWLHALRGARSTSTPLSAVRSAALVFDSGKKLNLELNGANDTYWVAMWPSRDLTGLLDLLASRGVQISRDW